MFVGVVICAEERRSGCFGFWFYFFLLYGCETWSIGAFKCGCPIYFSTRALHWLMGYRWDKFFSNEKVLQKITGMSLVTCMIRQRQLRLFGPVLRHPESDPLSRDQSGLEETQSEAVRDFRKSMAITGRWDWQEECMHATLLAETPRARTDPWPRDTLVLIMFRLLVFRVNFSFSFSLFI